MGIDHCGSGVSFEGTLIDALRTRCWFYGRVPRGPVGTNFRTVYLLKDVQGLVETPFMSADSKSALSNEEFEDIAWAAAIRKAFQLGWIA